MVVNSLPLNKEICTLFFFGSRFFWSVQALTWLKSIILKAGKANRKHRWNPAISFNYRYVCLWFISIVTKQMHRKSSETNHSRVAGAVRSTKRLNWLFYFSLVSFASKNQRKQFVSLELIIIEFTWNLMICFSFSVSIRVLFI